jgi:adenine/guanine phosphoribosyltransferase-like PRPP-binding protein
VARAVAVDVFAILTAQGAALHTVSVKRFLRTGQGGAVVLAAAEDVQGFYSDEIKLVTGPDGKQIAAAGAFAYPMTADYIPVRSELTLPATFGGHTVTVVTSSVGDGSGLPTPDHQEVRCV